MGERILAPGQTIRVEQLPPALLPSPNQLEALWSLHPAEFHDITMMGRRVKTPRWQQAYGVDYRYTGNVNVALPVPAALHPYLEFARGYETRTNGLLLNWYDPAKKHYIGRHRDANPGRIDGTPIVTISLGGSRVFRLRPWRGDGERVDIELHHGTVVVMSWATNLAWTHEVPHRQRDTERRISITARAFDAT